jgi:hypothetical protein
MKNSEMLKERIETAKSLIAAREAELARIPSEKEEILGGEEIDQGGLHTLEEKETTLAREVANLRTRVTLLEKQQEVAEKQEAAERLLAIAKEATKLIADLAPALDTLTQAERALVEKARGVAEIHAHHQELIYETAYFMDRYRLPRPSVP